MSIKDTALLVKETVGQMDRPFDLPASTAVCELVQIYRRVSNKANVKLKLGKGVYPILNISTTCQYVNIDSRVVTFNYLHDTHAKISIKSYSDFWCFLESLEDPNHAHQCDTCHR
jgi:hypothetical protein